MVNPIRGGPPLPAKSAGKKKSTKEVNNRVRKAAGKIKPPPSDKAAAELHASKKFASKEAYSAAEKAAATARARSSDIRQAGVSAQKKTSLAQRERLRARAALMKKIRATERAKKAALEASKKESALKRLAQIHKYLISPKLKEKYRFLKKKLLKSKNKKKK